MSESTRVSTSTAFDTAINLFSQKNEEREEKIDKNETLTEILEIEEPKPKCTLSVTIHEPKPILKEETKVREPTISRVA